MMVKLKLQYKKLFTITFLVLIVVWYIGFLARKKLNFLVISDLYTLARSNSREDNYYNNVSVTRMSLFRTDEKRILSSFSLENYHKIFQEESCPLCFGLDLCEDIGAGFLVVTYENPKFCDNLCYSASFGDVYQLLVKVPEVKGFAALDQYVCKAANQNDCNVSFAVEDLNLILAESLSYSSLEKFFKELGISVREFLFLMCGGPKILSVLKSSYDENDDFILDTDEKLLLLTSLIASSELVILRVLNKLEVNIGIPHYFGSCGRAFMVQVEVVPLYQMINHSFSVRVALATQLIALVDVLMDDPEWSYFQPSFEFDHFGVNNNGEIVLVNTSRLVVIDKEILGVYTNDENSHGGNVCNGECFHNFTQYIYRDSKK